LLFNREVEIYHSNNSYPIVVLDGCAKEDGLRELLYNNSYYDFLKVQVAIKFIEIKYKLLLDYTYTNVNRCRSIQETITSSTYNLDLLNIGRTEASRANEHSLALHACVRLIY